MYSRGEYVSKKSETVYQWFWGNLKLSDVMMNQTSLKLLIVFFLNTIYQTFLKLFLAMQVNIINLKHAFLIYMEMCANLFILQN